MIPASGKYTLSGLVTVTSRPATSRTTGSGLLGTARAYLGDRARYDDGMRRVRAALVVLALVAGAAALALWAAQPYLEQRVSGYIAQAGAAAGVTIGTVHFSWNEPLRLDNVIVDRPDTGRVRVERADVRWDFAGGREPRAHVRGFDLRGIRMQRGPLTMELSETRFDVVSWEVHDGVEHLRLRQIPSGGEFEARWRTRAKTADIGLTLSRFDLASARVRWSGDDVLQPGAWTGSVGVSSAGRDLTLRGAASAEGVRIKLPPSFGGRGSSARRSRSISSGKRSAATVRST